MPEEVKPPVAPDAQPAEPKVSEPPKVEPEAPKAPEAKPTEPKKESEQPPTPKKVVPEKYEFKVAENSVLDSRHVEKIAAYAKEQGLSQQEAQELLDGEAEAVAKEVRDLSAEFLNQSKADKEIGGEAFDKSVALGNAALEKFATPELRKILDRTGYGNHPEWIRFVARIGKAMESDKFVPNEPAAVPGEITKSRVSKFYPNA